MASCLATFIQVAADGKESACSVGDLGSILELKRSPGEGNGYPSWHSRLEISKGRGARWAKVYAVAEGWT